VFIEKGVGKIESGSMKSEKIDSINHNEIFVEEEGEVVTIHTNFF
jgi:hypothetical protein